MQPPVVLVVSPDRDFAAVVAEQVKQQLAFSCSVLTDGSTLHDMAPAPALIIASEPLDTDIPLLVPAKPFRLPELLAEAAALIHKPAGNDTLALRRGYALHSKQKQLVGATGQSIDLTDKEMQLLQCLAESTGDSVSKEQLLKTVWGFDSPLETHTLETHIYRLRGKLRELGEEDMIAAVEGGYRLG